MLDWIRRGEGPWRGLAVFFFVLIIIAWIGGGFGPRDYHECVLRHLPATSHVAVAGMIHDACAAKFGAPRATR